MLHLTSIIPSELLYSAFGAKMLQTTCNTVHERHLAKYLRIQYVRNPGRVVISLLAHFQKFSKLHNIF